MRSALNDATSTETTLHSRRAIIVLVCLAAALSYATPRLLASLLLNLQTEWPLWPGCAILVAILMLVHTKIWPALILVSFTGFVLFDLSAGVPVASIAWFVPANTVQVLTAAIGLRYYFGSRVPRLNNVNSFVKYGFVAVLLAPGLAAFVSARGIPGDYWTSWKTHETKQELLNFHERIRDLSTDMHSLSHQLHSST